MYSLLATAFKQFRNGHNAVFDANLHCGCCANRAVNFAEIVVRHLEGDCSFKILKLFAERILKPAHASAVHPQRVVLFFNVAGADLLPVWIALHHDLLRRDNLSRAVPSGGLFEVTEMGYAVGFYVLGEITLRTRSKKTSYPRTDKEMLISSAMWPCSCA